MSDLFVQTAGLDLNRDTAEVVVVESGANIAVPNDTPAHYGARWGGTNLLPSPADFSAASWIKEGSITASGNVVNFIAGTSSADRLRHNLLPDGQDRNGRSFRISVKVPPASEWSDPDAVLSFSNSTILTPVVTINSSSEEKIYSKELLTYASGGNTSLMLYSDRVTTITGLELYVEDVTDDVSKTPSSPSGYGEWHDTYKANYINENNELVELSGAEIDQCKYFDGVDDRIDLESDIEIVIGDVIEFCFSTPETNLAVNTPIIDKDDATDRGHLYLDLGTGTIRGFVSISASVNGGGNSYNLDGALYHASVRFNAPGGYYNRFAANRILSAHFEGSLFNIIHRSSNGAVKHFWRLNELDSTFAIDLIGGVKGVYINMPDPLPLRESVMKGLQVHGFDFTNLVEDSQDLSTSYHVSTGTTTPSPGALRVKGLSYTRMDRVGGTTNDSFRTGVHTTEASHYCSMVALLAGPGGAGDQNVRVGLRNNSDGAWFGISVEARGPGTISGASSGATILRVENLSETEPTFVICRTTSSVPASKLVYADVYLNSLSNDDCTVYASAFTLGKGHVPRIVHTTGLAAVGDRDEYTRTLPVAITNGIQFLIIFRPLFNHDDDKSNGYRLLTFLGATSAHLYEVWLNTANDEIYITKKNTGQSDVVLTIDGNGYSRMDRVTLAAYATDAGMAFSFNGGAWSTPNTSTGATADWSSPITTVAVCGRPTEALGCSAIIEHLSYKTAGETVVLVSDGASGLDTDPLPVISDTIEYSPFLYDAAGNAVPDAIVRYTDDGDLCIEGVPAGSYTLKGVRAKLGGAWTELEDLFISISDPSTLVSLKSPIIVTKRTDGRWLSG